MALGRRQLPVSWTVPAAQNQAFLEIWDAFSNLQESIAVSAGLADLEAGVGIAKHQLVYISANKLYLADVDAVATLAHGMALATVSAGQRCPFLLLQGYVSGLTGLTAGQVYYLSSTPGAMATSPVAVTTNQALGYALSTTEFLLSISVYR